MSVTPLASPLVGLLPSLPGFDLSRRIRPLERRRREPFTPDALPGPYRLPKAVCESLGALLAPFRNREAAFALATFLARHWSSPDRLGRAFPIDRRALTDHAKLGLSEARVRGAIQTLERIGFLDRPLTVPGSPYRATEIGLKRKPILFMFGAAFVPWFQIANRTGATKRRAVIQPRDHRAITKSPKDRFISDNPVLKGDVARAFEKPVMSDPSSPLEQALANLRKCILRP
jgi:hypothetical protein